MIKTTQDNFVWKVLTENEAKLVFATGVFELYILYSDESDALVETFEEIAKAVKEGAELVIEVGFYSKK